MNCPLCVDQSLDVHRRGGIEIDVCPNCHGVWLDRDELDRLMGSDVSTSRSSVVQAPSGFLVDTDGRSGKGATSGTSDKPKKDKSDKKKRKKSLGERLGDVLEEVLDI